MFKFIYSQETHKPTHRDITFIYVNGHVFAYFAIRKPTIAAHCIVMIFW